MDEYSSSSLVDYVVVCGLDVDKGIETNKLTGESLGLPPLERSYKSSVLQHFPDNLVTHPVDKDAVAIMGLPGGVKFRTLPAEPKLHPFLVTREDGSRIYGMTLTIYEFVESNEVSEAMRALQNMYRIEVLAANQEKRRARNATTTSNTLPTNAQTEVSAALPAQTRQISTSNYHTRSASVQSSSRGSSPGKLVSPPQDSRSSFFSSDVFNSLPRWPKLSIPASPFRQRRASQRSFAGGDGDAGLSESVQNSRVLNPCPPTMPASTDAVEIGCDKSDELMKRSLAPERLLRLYASKAICLLCRKPLVATLRKLLVLICGHFALGECTSDLPLECHLYHILYSVPMPDPGQSVRFGFCARTLISHLPGATDLPVLEFSLREMFSLLGVGHVLHIYTCVLLEHQVLLCSTDHERLMLVAECITSLLFPFAWQHVYVPILPASMTHFLDAPVPFIMGLCYTERNAIELPREGNICFVDLDTGELVMPEGLPQFPMHMQLVDELMPFMDRSGLFTPPEPTPTVSPASSPTCPKSSNASTKIALRSRSNSSDAENEKPEMEKQAILPEPNFQARVQMLQNNEALAKLTSLVKKSGVIMSFADIADKLAGADIKHESTKPTLSPEITITRRWWLRQMRGCGLEAGDRSTIDLIEQKFNAAVREIFLNRFIEIFHQYESFVTYPHASTDMDDWLTSQDTGATFDKCSFLSDQPEAHLPFLSAFLETQTFASFVMSKVLSHWVPAEREISVFDARLRLGAGGERTPTVYTPCDSIEKAEAAVEKWFSTMDQSIGSPDDLTSARLQLQSAKDSNIKSATLIPYAHKASSHVRLPTFSSRLLQKPPAFSSPAKRTKARPSGLKSCRITSSQLRMINQAKAQRQQPRMKDSSGPIDHQQFIERLLLDCKKKTKRILVEKMSSDEAIKLGHAPTGVSKDTHGIMSGVEENTLIGSLCDLLERVWSHGLIKKDGKSAFWSHLMAYKEFDSRGQIVHHDNSGRSRHVLSAVNQIGSSTSLERSTAVHAWSLSANNHNNLRHSRAHSTDRVMFTDSDEADFARHGRSHTLQQSVASNQSPNHLMNDLKSVLAFTDIRTEVGCARAFIRLALEKKLLARHLRELLRHERILKNLYRGYAFLRGEEERDQLIYHLLSLNVVEFNCFSGCFTSIALRYRVIIVPSRRIIGASTTATAWLSVSGQLASTKQIRVPRNTLQFAFVHKNLGLLSTLTIGHDSAGLSPNWLVECIFIRNEVTDHLYRFPCGRWLGRGADDGSVSRLLVAERVPPGTTMEEVVGSAISSAQRSPLLSARRQNAGMNSAAANSAVSAAAELNLQISDIQELLGNSVNSLVKFFHLPAAKQAPGDGGVTLVQLLCGGSGLVTALRHVFTYGMCRSRGIMFRRFYVWDFLEQVHTYLQRLLSNSARLEKIPEQAKQACRSLCYVMGVIDANSESIGKDGKFQILVCVGLRDHLLAKWVSVAAQTPVAESVYEEQSFVRDKALLKFVVRILDSLRDYTVTLDPSLTYGINL